MEIEFIFQFEIVEIHQKQIPHGIQKVTDQREGGEASFIGDSPLEPPLFLKEIGRREVHDALAGFGTFQTELIRVSENIVQQAITMRMENEI